MVSRSERGLCGHKCIRKWQSGEGIDLLKATPTQLRAGHHTFNSTSSQFSHVIPFEVWERKTLLPKSHRNTKHQFVSCRRPSDPVCHSRSSLKLKITSVLPLAKMPARVTAKASTPAILQELHDIRAYTVRDAQRVVELGTAVIKRGWTKSRSDEGELKGRATSASSLLTSNT